jgi:hypothetical protein
MKAMTGNPRVKSVPSAATIALMSLLAGAGPAAAEVSQETLDSLSAPDKIVRAGHDTTMFWYLVSPGRAKTRPLSRIKPR